MNTRDLINAWDEGVERALGNTSRADELGEEQLNAIAGMSVQSGVKGGDFWSDARTCAATCNTCQDNFYCQA